MSILKKHNIVIVGCGLVGMTLALFLAKHKIKVTIIEKNKSSKLSKINDSRTSAISQGTSRILNEIEIWQKVEKKAQEINSITVKEGNGNIIDFDSKSMQEGPLGFIVENKVLKKTVLKEIIKSEYVKLISDTEALEITNEDNGPVKIKTKRGRIEANLLVGADGRYSKVREMTEFKYYFNDYKQKAYVFNITHTKPHKSLALEYFFSSGPLALLPMKNNKQNISSVVWTTESQHKFKNKGSLFNEFKKKYRDFFGTILNATNPVEYNLNVFYCYKYFKNKVVLIGDACQAIHPIAGQGLNLGIRDSYFLANSLKEAEDIGLEYSDSIVLEKYTQNRIIDKKLLIQSTHNLNRLFSNSSITFSLFRKIGMRIFNKSKFLKEQSMLFAMGLKDFKL